MLVDDIAPLELRDGKLTEPQVVSLSNAVRALISRFAGGLSHGTGVSGHRGNFDEQFYDVITPSVADTEFLVPHQLGRIPIGIEVANANKAAAIYQSSAGSWSDSLIYLKCNVAAAQLKLRMY